jgi:hypothetical protein
MYSMGQGVPQDAEQAAQWYRRAANQGLSVAQERLGGLYAMGQGVPQDYAQAAQLFRKAADQGLAISQFIIGGMYYEGEGVPQDYAQAMMWVLVAKASGEPRVDQVLPVIESKATPAQIAEGQRMAREWSSVHHPGK